MYCSNEVSLRNASGSTPPCFSRLSCARAFSCSSVQPAFATPITGMSSVPRRTIACSAGKICLYAKSPVAPKNTSASDCSAMGLALLLEMSAEPQSHRRLDLLRVVGLATRGEAAVERGAQHGCGYALVDGREDRPAALARVRHAAGELRELRILGERLRGEVEQPRRDDAAAPPDLGDLREVEVVLVVLRAAQGRRLGVDVAALRAGVRLVEDVEALGVRRHEPVLDPVVDHLHEMAGAARTAVQVALLGRPRRGAAGRRRRAGLPGCESREDGIETPHRLGVAADHLAVAALETPHAAARADVEVVETLRGELVGGAGVVGGVGI